MRTLRKNQQRMKYSLQLGTVPKYLRDEAGNIRYESYTDSEGNEIFILNDEGEKIPLDEGGEKILFSTPCDFLASVSMSGGEAEAREFGLDFSAYDAIALYSNGTAQLVEGSLIWFKNEPKCEYEKEVPFEIEKGDKKETVYSTDPRSESADFRIAKISQSLNFSKAILKAVTK